MDLQKFFWGTLYLYIEQRSKQIPINKPVAIYLHVQSRIEYFWKYLDQQTAEWNKKRDPETQTLVRSSHRVSIFRFVLVIFIIGLFVLRFLTTELRYATDTAIVMAVILLLISGEMFYKTGKVIYSLKLLFSFHLSYLPEYDHNLEPKLFFYEMTELDTVQNLKYGILKKLARDLGIYGLSGLKKIAPQTKEVGAHPSGGSILKHIYLNPRKALSQHVPRWMLLMTSSLSFMFGLAFICLSGLLSISLVIASMFLLYLFAQCCSSGNIDERDLDTLKALIRMHQLMKKEEIVLVVAVNGENDFQKLSEFKNSGIKVCFLVKTMRNHAVNSKSDIHLDLTFPKLQHPDRRMTKELEENLFGLLRKKFNCAHLNIADFLSYALKMNTKYTVEEIFQFGSIYLRKLVDCSDLQGITCIEYLRENYFETALCASSHLETSPSLHHSIVNGSYPAMETDSLLHICEVPYVYIAGSVSNSVYA